MTERVGTRRSERTATTGEHRDEHGAATSGAEPDAAGRLLPAVVLVAVAVGVALRFMTRSPLWLDEALSVNIAGLPLGDIPDALRHDGHPPLYYALLHGWMQVVGTGDVAVRALSGIISVATLPLAYLAGRRLGGRTLGWLALGVFALSPFLIRYATETRMYSLVSFLTVAGFLLVDGIVRRGRDGALRLVLLALVAAALLYSHYWALWLVGGAGVVLLWVAVRGADPAMRRPARRAAAALVAGGVAFVPWLPVMHYQSQHTGTPWSGPVRPTSMFAVTMTDFGGGTGGSALVDAQFVGGVMLVLVLLAVFGRMLDGRRVEIDLRTVPQFRAEAAVVVTTIGLALLVMYATTSAFASRYTSTFVPLLLLLVAGGLSRFGDRRVRLGALVTVFALFAIGGAYNIRTERTQINQIAAAVTARSQTGDLVLYCPDQLAPAGIRAMPGGLEHLAFPHLPGGTWPAERVDWVDYAEANGIDAVAYGQAIAAHATPARSVFVVYSSGYKTHEGTCEKAVHGLSLARGAPETMVSEDGAKFFEHESLLVFPPVPPPA